MTRLRLSAAPIGLLLVWASYEISNAAEQKFLCSDKPSREEIFRSEYCDGLAGAKESPEPRANRPESSETYRLLWFRSFHPAVVIRIDVQPNGSGLLTLHSPQTLVAEGESRTEIANRPINRLGKLGAQEASMFKALLIRANFWTAPAQYHLDMGFGQFGTSIPKDDEVIMSDGAQWVIEGQDRTRYHVIGDDGGAFDGPVKDIGTAMIELAQMKFPSWRRGPIY